MAPLETLGWIHIRLPKPMVVNGFGLRSAGDNPERDPKHIRFLAKLLD